MTTTDPHRLNADHLPTPFTADEIRDGCPPGRVVRSRVFDDGATCIQVTRFVSGDTEGTEQEFWTETLDGAPLTELRQRRSTWLELQAHASMPAATTDIADETIEIPAGRFDCLRYRRTDSGTVMTFWFARSAPGMPLQFEERRDGTLVYSSVAIEDRRD